MSLKALYSLKGFIIKILYFLIKKYVMLQILTSVLTIPMTVTSVPSVLTLRVVLNATADQGYRETGEFVQVIITIKPAKTVC